MSFNSSFWQRRNSGIMRQDSGFDELRSNKGKKSTYSPSPKRSIRPSVFVAQNGTNDRQHFIKPRNPPGRASPKAKKKAIQVYQAPSRMTAGPLNAASGRQSRISQEGSLGGNAPDTGSFLAATADSFYRRRINHECNQNITNSPGRRPRVEHFVPI